MCFRLRWFFPRSLEGLLSFFTLTLPTEFRELPYSEYDQYLLRQEHDLTPDQLHDSTLLERLKMEGMRIDFPRSVAISEVGC